MKRLSLIALLLVSACAHDDPLSNLNLAVNHEVRYVSDIPAQDHWQTPEETERLKTGDCEDFAILKMAELPPEYRGNLVVVKELSTNKYHVILRATAPDGEVSYLDNMREQPVPEDHFNWYYRHIKTLQPGAMTRQDFIYGSAAQ